MQARTLPDLLQVAATAAPQASWTSQVRRHRPATQALPRPFCDGHACAASHDCVQRPGPWPWRSQVLPAAQSALERQASPTKPIEPGTQASTTRALP